MNKSFSERLLRALVMDFCINVALVLNLVFV